MFWIGTLLTGIGTMTYVSKLYLYWQVSRDLYRGGGVPVLDLPIVYPIVIAVGVTQILRSMDSIPFSLFGFVVWLIILLPTLGLMVLFESLGEPLRSEQMRKFQERMNKNH